MEVKDVITIFEGESYRVGTGTNAITIPARVKKTYNIENGDILGIAIFKIIKKNKELIAIKKELKKPTKELDKEVLKEVKKFSFS